MYSNYCIVLRKFSSCNFILDSKELIAISTQGSIAINKWISKLKDELVDVVYDEFTIGEWPTPIPEFDISENVFLLKRINLRLLAT